MILKPPHNLFSQECADLITAEKDLKILEQVRTLKAMVDLREIEFARMFFEKSYQENMKSETHEEAMIDAAADVWLVARLLSDRFGSPLRPKQNKQ